MERPRTGSRKKLIAQVSVLKATAEAKAEGDEVHVHVRIQNHGHVASIETKRTLLADRKTRVRPAYYSENYVSLLPGESREIEINAPKTAASGARPGGQTV